MKKCFKKMVLIPLLVVAGMLVTYECWAYARAFTEDWVGITVADASGSGAVPKVYANVFNRESGVAPNYKMDRTDDDLRFVFCFYEKGKYEIVFKAPDYEDAFLFLDVDKKPEGEASETVIVGALRMKRLKK